MPPSLDYSSSTKVWVLHWTLSKSQSGGAFQDYSNRNPSYDRTAGSKPESEIFDSFQPQEDVAQGKDARKKKPQKGPKSAPKASQIPVPMEHANSNQQKQMNETSMAQPDMFDRNASQVI